MVKPFKLVKTAQKKPVLACCDPEALIPKPYPVTEKTYRCKELYIETIVRNPEKVGLFDDR